MALTPAEVARLDAACAAGNDGIGALAGLYGGRAARETAKALLGTPDRARPQQVYTPQCVVDALARLWPEGTALDACGGPESIVPAERAYYVPPRYRVEQRTRKGRTVDVEVEYFEAQPGDTDGLVLPWTERTWCNPPFKYLRAWMAHAAQQPAERLMIAPVRTRRGWWLDYADTCDSVLWVNAGFRFRGHAQACPFDLALLYHGERVDLLADAFADIARAGRW